MNDATKLKHQRRSLRLLVATIETHQHELSLPRQPIYPLSQPTGLGNNIPQLKMLTPLQRQLRLGLANRALKPQHHLFRRLCFFVEHRFSLTAVTGLFAVVAAFSLGEEGGL